MRRVIVIAILFALYVIYQLCAPINVNNYRLLIPRNSSAKSIVNDLDRHQVIHSKYLMLYALRLIGCDTKITAGIYIFNGSVSSIDIINRLRRGHPNYLSVTIVDGWTLSQLRSYINSLHDIKHLTTYMSDESLRIALHYPYPSLEGAFYANSYYVNPDDTDISIYTTALNVMQHKLELLFSHVDQNIIHNSYELLILSSLIQKETSRESDLALVSSVFHNRLKRHMKLQDDPAVLYGMVKFAMKDFKSNTPYNTYLHYGLPPTPICIPSDASLVAATTPANSAYLYFISDRSGHCWFTTHFKQHNFLKRQIYGHKNNATTRI